MKRNESEEPEGLVKRSFGNGKGQRIIEIRERRVNGNGERDDRKGKGRNVDFLSKEILETGRSKGPMKGGEGWGREG